eukprot:4912148-Pleurochrysis_carterae.AAC.3
MEAAVHVVGCVVGGHDLDVRGSSRGMDSKSAMPILMRIAAGYVPLEKATPSNKRQKLAVP